MNKPESISSDPALSEIWDSLVSDRFTEEDVPALELLCFWHAVANQAREAISRGDGHVAIFDRIGTKPFKKPNGETAPLFRKNPALTVLKEASNEIRALNDQLGISPKYRTEQKEESKTPNALLLKTVFADREAKEKKAAGA